MSLSPRWRRWLAPVALLAGALTVGASGGDDDDTQPASTGGEDASGAVEVLIEGFDFVPDDLEVAAGTTVTWTNEDSAAHSVVDDGLFESEDMAEGDEFSHTYEAPGKYPYICGIHPFMTATVTVT